MAMNSNLVKAGCVVIFAAMVGNANAKERDPNDPKSIFAPDKPDTVMRTYNKEHCDTVYPFNKSKKPSIEDVTSDAFEILKGSYQTEAEFEGALTVLNDKKVNLVSGELKIGQKDQVEAVFFNDTQAERRVLVVKNSHVNYSNLSTNVGNMRWMIKQIDRGDLLQEHGTHVIFKQESAGGFNYRHFPDVLQVSNGNLLNGMDKRDKEVDIASSLKINVRPEIWQNICQPK